MSKPKVIVTRRWHADVEAVLCERYDTRLNSDDHPMSSAELQDALRNADAVLPTVSDRVWPTDRSQLPPVPTLWLPPTRVVREPPTLNESPPATFTLRCPLKF